jgi:hypothetical protein
MTEKVLFKDPDAILDYVFDWTDWLEVGETISSQTITVAAGLTKDSDSESSGIVTIWLSGGTADTDYIVACKIVTNLSRTDERSISIHCLER